MPSLQGNRSRPASSGNLSTISGKAPRKLFANGNDVERSATTTTTATTAGATGSGLTNSRTFSRRTSSLGPNAGIATGNGGPEKGTTGKQTAAARVRCVTKRPPSTPVRSVTTVRENDAASARLPPPHQTHSRLGNEESMRNSSLAARGSASEGSGNASVKPRRRYVVGVMSHCGSIYEELTRQLVATGRWTAVTVKQRTGVKTLFVDSTLQDISEVNIHLLLGDKPSCERVIAARRGLWTRLHHGPPKPASQLMMSARVPMGCGDDGEPRVIDFVENTRCITLKNTMVSTLLRYHHYDWSVLGSYLPMTFKITSNKPLDDERRQLLEETKKFTAGNAPLWIAKSSSGCHGDDIEIFPGDRAGVQRLLAYIDARKYSWVAQQYIDRPLLYHKRKFDIRVMALYIRDTNEVFVHEDLVMRMSSVPYDRESATGNSQEAKLAHITNHCIQESGNMYAAFEEGNELWKEHLDGLIRYKADRLPASRRRELLKPAPSTNHSTLSTSRSAHNGAVHGNSPHPTDLAHGEQANGGSGHPGTKGSASGITLKNAIMPQVHRIVVDTVLAAQPHLPREPHPAPTHCFQVLGYDFLLDEDLKVWLLEINGAPGGPTRLIPKIMADTIELAINPFFPCSLDSRPSAKNGYTRVYPE